MLSGEKPYTGRSALEVLEMHRKAPVPVLPTFVSRFQPMLEKLMAKDGKTISDYDLFEANEAFAVQVIAFLDHFGIADDDPRVNPYGGAIAVGHPLASSGVRLMLNLARTFESQPEVRYGITTMCIGLGMGGTVIWENPNFKGAK